jgi:hypothetical protein
MGNTGTAITIGTAITTRVKRGISLLAVAGVLALLPAAAAAVSAPVLTSVTQTSARHIKLAWSGQFQSPIVEVAVSPGVDTTGYFTDPNAVSQPLDDFETSWESDPFPAGTYYVHVGGLDPSCFSCGLQFSSVRQIKIGSSGGAKQPKPPLFSVLSVRATQRVGSVFVRAGMVSPGTISAGGSVSAHGKSALYRFKTISVSAPATLGASVKLRLRLPAKALRAVKRALSKGRKLKAKIKITAHPLSGSAQAATRIVKLKR